MRAGRPREEFRENPQKKDNEIEIRENDETFQNSECRRPQRRQRCWLIFVKRLWLLSRYTGTKWPNKWIQNWYVIFEAEQSLTEVLSRFQSKQRIRFHRSQTVGKRDPRKAMTLRIVPWFRRSGHSTSSEASLFTSFQHQRYSVNLILRKQATCRGKDQSRI